MKVIAIGNQSTDSFSVIRSKSDELQAPFVRPYRNCHLRTEDKVVRVESINSYQSNNSNLVEKLMLV